MGQDSSWLNQHAQLVSILSEHGHDNTLLTMYETMISLQLLLLLLLICQVMPQLLSFLDVDMEDPHAPDW